MSKVVHSKQLPTGHLTNRQRRALEALASGATRDQTGILVGRQTRTINRWIEHEPAFQEAIKGTTKLAVADAARRLAGMLDDALTALHTVITDPDAKPRDILRANDIIVSNLIKLREFDELEERIAALEEQLRQ